MLFSRVCFHYGLSYGELMRLPVKTFWMLNKNINRLRAEMDLRALSIAGVSQDADTFEKYREALLKEFDNPYKTDPIAMAELERDADATNKLKRLAKGGK